MLGYICGDFGAGLTWNPAAIGLICTGEVGMHLRTEHRNMVFIYDGTVHLLKAECPAAAAHEAIGAWVCLHIAVQQQRHQAAHSHAAVRRRRSVQSMLDHNSNNAAVESVL
jgi:hypothetical protein